MKIIKLRSENIKGIKAVEISPDANIVKITGKNGQGKTSVLDSIMYALGGKKAIPSQPIRNGEEKAEIELDLGDYTVKRVITEKSDKLEVMSKDGASFKSPQAMLDKLTGDLSFDPLEFTRRTPALQKETLLQVAGVQVEDLESKYRETYDERTFVGRKLKDAKGMLNTLQKPEKEVELIDTTVLEKNLADKRTINFNREQSLTEITRNEDEVKRLQARIEELETKNCTIAENLPDYCNIEELEKELAMARENNNIFYVQKEYKDAELAVNSLSKEYEALSKNLDSLVAEKSDRLDKANLPLEGLSFNSNGVTFNNVPFDQLSGAEQLKVSASIAMSANPKLSVMLIRDGSLLDDDNFKVLEELANEHDFQIWVEVVDSSGKIGFYIEEGELK